MRKKTIAQQLKDEFKENYRFHQQCMDLRRNAQSLLRQTNARFASNPCPVRLELCLLQDLHYAVPIA